MSDIKSSGLSGLKGLKKSRRKSIRLTGDSLVKMEVMAGKPGRPLVIEPSMPHVNLIAWAQEHRAEVEQKLLQHGALLFRGFEVNQVEAFQDFCRALCPELLEYIERAAPRNKLADKVFTSTEYPADQWIPLHHEMSYSHNWPTKLFFYCDVEPEVDGFTPFTNELEMINKIPEEIKRRFLDSGGVMYVRNYGEGVDMSWQEVFQTEDKREVEQRLKETRTSYEWLGENRLRTRAVRQVLATHPVTGDTVWFNHAHMFHISNMPQAVREALLEEFADDELPRNSFYGDGSRIEDEVATQIRDLYQANAITFPWQKGDILILDNFLTAHGRSPFSGERRICVAMAELYTNPDFR